MIQKHSTHQFSRAVICGWPTVPFKYHLYLYHVSSQNMYMDLKSVQTRAKPRAKPAKQLLVSCEGNGRRHFTFCGVSPEIPGKAPPSTGDFLFRKLSNNYNSLHIIPNFKTLTNTTVATHTALRNCLRALPQVVALLRNYGSFIN